MGVGKVLNFFIHSGVSLLVWGVTASLAGLAYRRRKERGLLWLWLGLVVQFIGALIGSIASSPIVLVEYPVTLWLHYISYYATMAAAVCSLVGWFLLSRKKSE